MKGKDPLSGNFDIQIDAFNGSYVVVELPVLVAITRAHFASVHPTGIKLVAEVTSGTKRRVITETIPPEAVYESLPTLVFLKTAIPTSADTGEIRYLVKVGELPAPPPPPPAEPPPKGAPTEVAEPPPPPAPPKDRFARTTVFRRP